MPRYEFREGTSSKFWQIDLDGTSFTTTFGRIGAAGQTSTKSFDRDDRAQAEYAKLIAEKTRKGYQLVGAGAPAVAAPSPRPPTPRAGPPAPPAAVLTAPAAPPTATAAAAVVAPPRASAAGPSLVFSAAAHQAAAREQAAIAIPPRTISLPAEGAWLRVHRGFVERNKRGIQDGVIRGDARSQRLSNAVLKEYGGLETLPTTLDAATAAAALQLGILVQGHDSHTAELIDFWVAHAGLGFALEAFAASLWDLDTTTGEGVRGAMTRWLAPVARRSVASLFARRADRILHGHWLGATEFQRAAARARAEELRARGRLLERSLLASCLLDPGWIDADLREHATSGARAMFSPEALLQASAPADVARYLSDQGPEDEGFHLLVPTPSPARADQAASNLTYTLVQRFGLVGVDLLCAQIARILPQWATYQGVAWARKLRDLLEVVRLAHDHPLAATAALAVIEAAGDHKLAKDDDPRPLAFECLRNAPAIALPLVRDAAKRKGGAWAKSLLPQLERLAGGGAEEARPDADADAVPAVLRATRAAFKAPEFWHPAALPRLALLDGTLLPIAELGAVGAVLKAGDPAALAALKLAADPASLAAFAWELFLAWLTGGAPAKEKWAFTALGPLGTDDTARRLTPLIRAWPGESQHARAVAGLDVLGEIGSDVALMMLNGIAQKVKFKGLQERARGKMDEIAAKRGMTAEELADRLVPDLDLEDDGSKTLDFGPRSFRVGFDEALAPFVIDATGARLRDLPKPGGKDDATLAAEAVEVWKAMKKDVRALASIQLVRLELAMGNGRRWSGQDFRNFFVEHPLLTHLVRRLVWGVYAPAPAGGRGALLRTLRVAEDRSYADQRDEACALAAGELVGIAHRLHLGDADVAAWGKLFGDYELAQPFEQLGREVFRLPASDRAATQLDRFANRVVETKKLLGLLSRGWRKGQPQDAGCIYEVYKPIRADLIAAVAFSNGLNAGGMDYVDPTQTLGVVDFSPTEPSWSARTDAIPLGDVDAVALSEVIRDLESMGEATA